MSIWTALVIVAVIVVVALLALGISVYRQSLMLPPPGWRDGEDRDKPRFRGLGWTRTGGHG